MENTLRETLSLLIMSHAPPRMALKHTPHTNATGSQMPKPKSKVSKWFRVAVEDATTDGREIQKNWIEEIAEQYDPNTYGARVNCEHIKSVMPDSMFGAYGDVLAVKAKEVEIAGKTKLALFAKIKP